MRKVAVVTCTRAEFGLLLPVIKKLRRYESDEFKVELIATGTHLSKKFGYTIDEIDNLGIRIDKIVEIPTDSDNEVSISINQAETLIKFTKIFSDEKYCSVVILGDRYELLSIAIAAGNTHTPIIHLCGGDTTEGAIDEWIRHAITKISFYHFVTNEQSYKRVIQLGENPSRVFNYGSTSIDNILNVPQMGKKEVLESIGFGKCQYALCTYHPVTLEDNCIEQDINALISAIKKFPQIEFFVTKANSDQGGGKINDIFDSAERIIDNLHVFSSFGVVRYLSLMKYAEFVIGNSSSGIIEAPSFKIPTINIGDRQRGRLKAESILDCNKDAESIIKTIMKAQSIKIKKLCLDVKNPYGDGNSADKIANKIYELIYLKNIDLKKKFYNISYVLREKEEDS